MASSLVKSISSSDPSILYMFFHPCSTSIPLSNLPEVRKAYLIGLVYLDMWHQTFKGTRATVEKNRSFEMAEAMGPEAQIEHVRFASCSLRISGLKQAWIKPRRMQAHFPGRQ